MRETPPFMEEKEADIVRHILDTHALGLQVYVFGSRAHGRGLKRFSDLDLALADPDGASVPDTVLSALCEAFEESDLPWKVDVLDLNAVSLDFRERIEEEMVEV